MYKTDNAKKDEGPTEIWTRIAGFRVLSANHYTMGPVIQFSIIYDLHGVERFWMGKRSGRQKEKVN